MASVRYFTFTGNPLAETTFEYATWEAGRTQRAKSTSFQMGGKGINVSKMLRRLGAATVALTFLGGLSGEACRRWLEERGFGYRAFDTRAATREGLVVRSAGRPETTFLGPDAPADGPAWDAAARWLEAATAVRDGAVFALCGSAPGWDSPEASSFRTVFERWISIGNPVCVDSYGPPLAWCVERAVALVKVNADEFRTLMGADARRGIDGLLSEAVVRWPVKAWVVTDGAGPVWAAEKGGRPFRKDPPRIEEVSATGSGDVMMACMMEALYSRGRTLAEAIDDAVPMAAANAAHPGIAEF